MATLSERDCGCKIEVTVGTGVTARLKENPTTSYRWTVETACRPARKKLFANQFVNRAMQS